MYGLYNLEARMNLREGPFLPGELKTVRHSLYNTRMVQSWMGWMEWPDNLLSHLAHDGFDALFTSVYANPNGDRGPADISTEFYARLLFRIRKQDPARMRDLINRAGKFGIKVYTPIIYQYLGTSESEAGLRKLVRDILRDFPDIRGYVLLTEGFYYKEWRAGHANNEEELREWARNWTRAVSIVAEECHRVDPAIEILPWEYNIDFRPEKANLKRYFIQQLPQDTIPLLTWENGKSFELEGLRGYLRDYSLNQIGPAEVTEAQIAETRDRKMKVYSKVDTFASWQFGTIPYLPCPYQWHARYQALEKYGVSGTLESWSSGYKPNFIAELRAWTCWTEAPPLEDLLAAVARRDFGAGAEKLVLKAWDHFSRAIRLVPDTGPHMGTNNAVGNPLFFQPPPARTMTLNYSWQDQAQWMGYFGGEINPYWPFTVSRMVFYPDFSNQTNKAEAYARSVSGIGSLKGQEGLKQKILPLFMKYLLLAADEMEEGLKLYRQAALLSSRRQAPAGGQGSCSGRADRADAAQQPGNPGVRGLAAATGAGVRFRKGQGSPGSDGKHPARRNCPHRAVAFGRQPGLTAGFSIRAGLRLHPLLAGRKAGTLAGIPRKADPGLPEKTLTDSKRARISESRGRYFIKVKQFLDSSELIGYILSTRRRQIDDSQE